MSAAKCGAEEKLTAYRFAHPGYACYRRTSLFHCAIARRDQTKCASSVAKFFVLDFLTAITMHLVYVDDSKDDKLACFSALLVPVDNWNDCLNRLINIRRTIKDRDQVPLRMELHATDWLSGKGSRVRHLGKPDRVRLFNYFLAGIAMLPGVQLINAAVPLHEDDRAFEWMMNRIDVNMRNAGSQAIIISDEGKSYDKLLRRMRR